MVKEEKEDRGGGGGREGKEAGRSRNIEMTNVEIGVFPHFLK